MINYPNKEVRELVKFAEANNFTVIYGRHLKFKRGAVVIGASTTPSCPYGLRHARKQLEKVIRNELSSRSDQGQQKR